jgi:hypothetical protein
MRTCYLHTNCLQTIFWQLAAICSALFKNGLLLVASRPSSLATRKETDKLLQCLLGDLGPVLFPHGTAENCVIARQTILLLMHGLERLKARYQMGDAARSAAASSYTELNEKAKRRRVE